MLARRGCTLAEPVEGRSATLSPGLRVRGRPGLCCAGGQRCTRRPPPALAMRQRRHSDNGARSPRSYRDLDSSHGPRAATSASRWYHRARSRATVPGACSATAAPPQAASAVASVRRRVSALLTRLAPIRHEPPHDDADGNQTAQNPERVAAVVPAALCGADKIGVAALPHAEPQDPLPPGGGLVAQAVAWAPGARRRGLQWGRGKITPPQRGRRRCRWARGGVTGTPSAVGASARSHSSSSEVRAARGRGRTWAMGRPVGHPASVGGKSAGRDACLLSARTGVGLPQARSLPRCCRLSWRGIPIRLDGGVPSTGSASAVPSRSTCRAGCGAGGRPRVVWAVMAPPPVA